MPFHCLVIRKRLLVGVGLDALDEFAELFLISDTIIGRW